MSPKRLEKLLRLSDCAIDAAIELVTSPERTAKDVSVAMEVLREFSSNAILDHTGSGEDEVKPQTAIVQSELEKILRRSEE